MRGPNKGTRYLTRDSFMCPQQEGIKGGICFGSARRRRQSPRLKFIISLLVEIIVLINLSLV